MNEWKYPKTEVGVDLREARWSDAKDLWLWRNDPVTRSNSLTHDLVTWVHHTDWLTEIFDSPERRLMIGLTYGFPMGTIRFDYGPDDAKLSWTVAPEFRHQGFGKALVKAAIQLEPKKVLVAWVMPHNKASLKIAESLGFVEESRSFSTIVLTRHPK